GVEASYRVTQRIARTGKPHNIGETLIGLACKDILFLIIGEDASRTTAKEVFKKSYIVETHGFGHKETITNIEIKNLTLNETNNQIEPYKHKKFFQEISILDTKAITNARKQLKTKLKHATNSKIKRMNSKSYDEYNALLESYIRACLKSNQTNAAFKIMETITRQDCIKLNNVGAISHLFNYLALINDSEKMHTAMKILRLSGFKPTFGILCCRLEHLSRFSNCKESIANVLSEIKLYSYDLTLFKQFCSTNPNAHFHVLKAIRKVYPNFVESSILSFKYNNSLLESLCIDFRKEFNVNIKLGLNSNSVYTNLLNKKLHHDQYNFECNHYTNVKSIDTREKIDDNTKIARRNLENLKVEWKSSLTNAFSFSLQILKNNSINHEMKNLLPYFTSLPASFFIDMMLQDVNIFGNNNIDKYAPSKSALIFNFGQRVVSEINDQHEINQKSKSFLQAYEHYIKYLSNNENVNNRLLWLYIIEKFNLDLKIPFKETSQLAIKMVGKFLYDIIMNNIQVKPMNCTNNRKVPAFYEVYRLSNSSLERAIRPHPSFIKIFKDAKLSDLSFYNYELPMLSPPLPWITSNYGGFLRHRAAFIRTKGNNNLINFKLKRVPNKQLYPIYDSINTISNVPWKVNTTILFVARKVFQSGGDMKLAIPKSPSYYDNPKTLLDFDNSKQKYYPYLKLFRKEKAEMYSLWCTELYRLSIANHYKQNYFWFPQNLDFRGRLYACPPHFSHIGSDLSRSLLLFANGKELGPNGLNWLKIHCINLTGKYKKCTNQERLSICNELMSEIIDSAKYPLHGRKWWQDSEDPWQTLAACTEIYKANQVNKPEEYICCLPVHQDGSCNGLQHYAALGRDDIGAESVNLKNLPRPSDVYSYVVDVIEKKRKIQAVDNIIARELENVITRKIIKQTVMTTVYGVTRYGARSQVMTKLNDLPGINKDNVFKWASYIVDCTFSCLQSMFTSSRDIQNWLINCARYLVDSDVVVEWKTPLGLPVLQPYFSLQKYNKSNGISEETINKRKQYTAIPPNFIHSLDASHMMLTSLYSVSSNFTFVSVHDCFWTHPSTVEIMNKVCREQFVALHSQPILSDLRDQFTELIKKDSKYAIKPNSKQKVFDNIPKTGTFDLNSILKSEYFFS
ncbi:hypothetical protein A3Q56_02812, partial [Intoshia linei]